MELPRRERGDELLPSGALVERRRRLRAVASKHDISAVIACAFDHRTRMLPFIFADTRMAPAGVRAIGSALVDAGFEKVRIVLQQWNRRFRPSRMKLDSRVPDLFLVSSMGMHSQQAMALIRDACRIDEAQRPLIIAGGPKAVYQPFLFYSDDPADPASADVVVTGEEFVLLSMLEAVLDLRAEGEPIRSAFFRARDQGALDDIPGLVYPVVDRARVERMIEAIKATGIRRMARFELGIAPDRDGFGMTASGVVMINPPFVLPGQMAEALPWLAERLGEAGQGCFRNETLVGE